MSNTLKLPRSRMGASRVTSLLISIVASMVLVLTVSPSPALAASFNAGPGRSWSISAQAPGGGAITPGGQLEVTVTMTWDSPMHSYVGGCTVGDLKGDTGDPRVPSMYFSSPAASPTSFLYPSCGPSLGLSDDFMTATWTTTITAPLSDGNYSVTAYSRGTTFFDDSFNFSFSAPFAYTVGSTIPDAPTSVTGIAGNTQVAVTWTPPTNNGGSTITGYTATASPGGATCTTATTDCTITSLTNGTAYTFTVSATNTNGNSPPSAPSTTITPSTIPDAPTSVTGIAGNTQVAVTWTPPTNNGGSTITGYTATASPGGATCTTATTDCTITSLTNGTAYTFTVSATNTNGNSPPSAPSTTITPVDPVEPKISVNKTNPASGDNIVVTGSGFAPQSNVEIWLDSDPVLLTTVTTDDLGGFSVTVALPKDLTGDHQIRAVGTATDGSPVTEVLNLAISAALPNTGFDPMDFLLLASLLIPAGAALVYWGNRRPLQVKAVESP